MRLKGGDPFVFGRGGEEWLACVAAGVPVTVVPGVSSALAAPAVAGIPLTHRGVASDFTVVSGHLDPGRAPDAAMDWPGLAAHGGTLVLLMGMERLAADRRGADRARAGARPPRPRWCTARPCPASRWCARRLSGLAAAVRAGASAPAAVIVIGAVVDVLPR